MTHVIAEPCIDVKSGECVDVCPVDCIHPRPDEDKFAAAKQLYIDPATCIDCGACVTVCPVTAIFPQADLPEKSKAYTDINRAWFTGETVAEAPPAGGPKAEAKNASTAAAKPTGRPAAAAARKVKLERAFEPHAPAEGARDVARRELEAQKKAHRLAKPEHLFN